MNTLDKRQRLRVSLPDGTSISEVAMQLHQENNGSSEGSTPEWRELARSWLRDWVSTWQPSVRAEFQESDDAMRAFLVAVANEPHWQDKSLNEVTSNAKP